MMRKRKFTKKNCIQKKFISGKFIAVCSALVLTGMLVTGCAGETNASETDGKETQQASAAVSEAQTSEGQVSEGQTKDGQAAETKTTEGQTAEEQSAAKQSAEAQSTLPDGVYTAEFHTDSSMFRVNEACDGMGTLTVENGEMMIHISLGSKKIVNLYPGLAEDAEKEGAELLLPTEDTVTYSDGMTEEVYGFDVPVPVLEEEFDLALIGTKGIWYDHKVSVSNPEPLEEGQAENGTENQAEGQTERQSANGTGNQTEKQTESQVQPENGTYTIEVTLEGGSGKATVLSPATITVTEDSMVAVIEWSSPNYDYMLVDGEKYLPVNTEGNSVFEIPVVGLDTELTVIGDTVAMSKPHEVEYTITFHAATMQAYDN